MEFVDKALARRLEAAEEMPQVQYAYLYQKLRPEIGAEVQPFCGGHMIFAGLNSLIGRTVGAGFDGPVPAADLDCMEAFYSAHAAPSQIDVCPLTDPGLLELLRQRGYVMTELNNVLYRRLEREEGATPPHSAAIRQAHPDEAGLFADMLRQCFFPEGNAPEDFGAMLTPMFQFDGVVLYVAEVEGRPAACGAGLIIPERGIVALFGAGTLPEFRGRGLQTALLRTRVKAAQEAGCEYAVIVTNGGTTSQRNAERLGFRVAYSKATLLKALVPAG
jgi:ribosomal protein S18 acetylase RimI-like enzyme